MSLSINKLPQIVNIISMDDVSDEYGDISSEATFASLVRCRITRNKKFGSTLQTDAGYVGKSTHVIFTNIIAGIKSGMIIVHGSDRYIILYADIRPGGVEDHHMQLYCNHQING